MDNYRYSCWQHNGPSLCKLEENNKRYVYESKAIFLNICEPLEGRLKSYFPNLEGFSAVGRMVSMNLPFVLINASLVLIIV